MFIGFSKTGEQVLNLIRDQNWLFQPQGDSGNPSPLLLISTGVSDGDSPPRSIVVKPADNRIGIFSKNSDDIRKLVTQYLGALGNHGPERCFVFASLSEQEVGVLQPLLECLADHPGFGLPELFLSIQSPDGSLPYQDRYAATLEIRHLLHESGHAGSRRLLGRIYLFDGSGDRDDYLRSTIAGMAGGALFFMNGGDRLAAHENSVINPSDGPLAVRALGSRIAVEPPVELINYFIWKYLQESWGGDKTLILLSRPSQSDIDEIFKDNCTELSECLNSWVGESLTAWLFQQNTGNSPEINLQSVRLRLLGSVTSLLLNEKKANRPALLWAGLSLLEAKTASHYPALQEAVRKSIEGLNYLSGNTAEIRSFFDEKIKEAKDEIIARAQAPVIRWMTSHAVIEEADRRYETVRGGLKNAMERTSQEITLEYQEAGNKIQWNLQRPVPVIDIRENYQSYFNSTFTRMREIIPGLMIMMEFSQTGWNKELNIFMQDANQPFVTHPAEGMRRHALLFAPETMNISLQPRPQFFPPPNRHMLAAMTVFTGLQMDKAGNIPMCSRVYSRQESLHINAYVKNAAYFESNLPQKYLKGRFFCDEVISYLDDRNATLAFFGAYFTSLLDWDKKRISWRIKPFDKYDEIMLSRERSDLLDEREEKNLQSLWKAYCRFVVDIPSSLDPGDWYHPLYKTKRLMYLEKTIEHSNQMELRLDRLEWLNEKAESITNNVVLYDFYCLTQSAWRIVNANTSKNMKTHHRKLER